MADPQQAAIRKVLAYSRRVAIVGLSDRPHRASFGVADAMRARGYEIIPVNPNLRSWEGIPAVSVLADVEGPIDIVDVFRRDEHLIDVAHEAVAVGAKSLWLQLGLESTEAAAIAADAGLDYVEDRCLKVEIARYAREMDIPPAA